RERSFLLSNLASLLRQGEFVVTAELNPPKSASGEVVKRRAAVLKGSVDAVNGTDSNRSVAAMAAIPAALLVREAGVEPIVQITGRDRNRIALQADLLGAAALGLSNFLFMSGDDPKHGNHPDAVYVKDLDGIGLVKMAVTMRDEHKFLSGDEIRQAPEYFIGATASRFAKPMSADLEKTVDKVTSGSDLLQTQPVFDLATFSQWLAELRRVGGGREAAGLAAHSTVMTGASSPRPAAPACLMRARGGRSASSIGSVWMSSTMVRSAGTTCSLRSRARGRAAIADRSSASTTTTRTSGRRSSPDRSRPTEGRSSATSNSREASLARSSRPRCADRSRSRPWRRIAITTRSRTARS